MKKFLVDTSARIEYFKGDKQALAVIHDKTLLIYLLPDQFLLN